VTDGKESRQTVTRSSILLRSPEKRRRFLSLQKTAGLETFQIACHGGQPPFLKEHSLTPTPTPTPVNGSWRGVGGKEGVGGGAKKEG